MRDVQTRIAERYTARGNKPPFTYVSGITANPAAQTRTAKNKGGLNMRAAIVALALLVAIPANAKTQKRHPASTSTVTKPKPEYLHKNRGVICP